MAKYRKKPVVVEAVQWTGENGAEIARFMDELWPMTNVYNQVIIITLEGYMLANPGDYIIKGVDGEFYPCKPDIFEKTYERVEEDD